MSAGKRALPRAWKTEHCFPTQHSHTSRLLPWGAQIPVARTRTAPTDKYTNSYYQWDISSHRAPQERPSHTAIPVFAAFLAPSGLSAQQEGDDLPGHCTLHAAVSPDRVPTAHSHSLPCQEQVNPISAPFDEAPALANTIRGSGRLQFTFQSVIRDTRSLPGAKISHQFTSNSLPFA